MASQTEFPTQGTRSELDPEIKDFLERNPELYLGGTNFLDERAHHTKVFGYHTVKADIDRVDFECIRGPHGTIPVRVFVPKSGAQRIKNATAGALIYMHGGGYTVGTVDEFENGLRLLAERSETQIYAVEYRLAPEWRYPTQLNEYKAVLDWVRGEGGQKRGVDPERVAGGGDSAGGNMTAALTLRMIDESEQPLKGQLLLYPEARVPFDTPAATENNSGLYLECNGIFSFADHYCPRGTPPSHRYISPGMQPIEKLKNLPPSVVLTCGFDPLRDVGVEYAHKLQKAGNQVVWHHFPSLTHGFLQLALWSAKCDEAVGIAAKELKKLVYG